MGKYRTWKWIKNEEKSSDKKNRQNHSYRKQRARDIRILSVATTGIGASGRCMALKQVLEVGARCPTLWRLAQIQRAGGHAKV